MGKHFWDTPQDWARMEEQGILDMLPCHSPGTPEPDSPAYFIDARHAVATGLIIGPMSHLLGEKQMNDDAYKHWIQHYCTPLQRLLREARLDWEHYEKLFREKSMV